MPKQLVSTSPMQKYAYVTYATSSKYALGSVAQFSQLRKLKSQGNFVLIHTCDLPERVVRKLRSLNVIMKRRNNFLQGVGTNSYYRNVFSKLLVFSLIEYDRITYVESDALVMRNIDHLFQKSTLLSMPIAYWLSTTFMTNVLMTFNSSAALWGSVKRGAQKLGGRNMYDMDVMNELFNSTTERLSPLYAVLNCEWQTPKPWLKFGSATQLWHNAYMIHFTCLGKPWNWPRLHSNVYMSKLQALWLTASSVE